MKNAIENNKECQKMVKKVNKFTNHVVAVVDFYIKRHILQKKLQEKVILDGTIVYHILIEIGTEIITGSRVKKGIFCCWTEDCGSSDDNKS